MVQYLADEVILSKESERYIFPPVIYAYLRTLIPTIANVQKAKVVKGGHHKEVLINGHVLSHRACNNVQILHLVLWHDLYMVYLYCIF